ncbi:helix-turn-helix domain-containing protein [Lacticaseibacillus kribbianus]|uniref:helix-turn-helix domain-containing protein n=1 Tax=Lacticaseibacillus kribbianus TaxID=2926292 RepID=UPI001CD296E9|nr:helix-turn-helix transcriptional regulator [Lacticaseibacillus kribbianus]
MGNQTLGAFVRQYRKDHQLTLAEAVSGAGCSTAALSRFERDQSDLGLATVNRILSNLQLSAENFEPFLNARPNALGEPLYREYIGRKLEAIKTRELAYRGFWPADRPSRSRDLALLLLRLCQRPLDAPVHLTSEEECLLADVLVVSPGWTATHALAIAAGLRFASAELLGLVAKRLSDYATGPNGMTGLRIGLTGADYAMLLIHALIRRDHAVIAALTPALAAYQAAQLKEPTFTRRRVAATRSQPVVAFAQAAARWLTDPRPATVAPITVIFRQLAGLRASDLLHHLQALWALIQTGQAAWHNPTLSETRPVPAAPSNWADWQFDGPTIKQVRRQYHFSLADVCVDWTPATQSRFEAGKTQLGFNAAIQLIDALFLDVSLIHRWLFSPAANAFEVALAAQPEGDPVAANLAALAVAKAALPRHPHGIYLLQASALSGRTYQRLASLGLSDEAAKAALGEPELPAQVLQGLRQTPHLYLSQLKDLTNCANLMSAPELLTAWRLVFAKARFNPATTPAVTTLFMYIILRLAEDGDADALASFQPAAVNLYADRLSVTGSVEFSGPALLLEAYLSPEDSDRAWATIAQNREAMLAFARPDAETASWIGDLFTCIEETVHPAFLRWQREQAIAAD